jgi:hypothetical protein
MNKPKRSLWDKLMEKKEIEEAKAKVEEEIVKLEGEKKVKIKKTGLKK